MDNIKYLNETVLKEEINKIDNLIKNTKFGITV